MVIFGVGTVSIVASLLWSPAKQSYCAYGAVTFRYSCTVPCGLKSHCQSHSNESILLNDAVFAVSVVSVVSVVSLRWRLVAATLLL